MFVWVLGLVGFLSVFDLATADAYVMSVKETKALHGTQVIPAIMSIQGLTM